MKRGKSSDPDNIPIEVIKDGCLEIKQTTYNFIKKCWEEECIPEEWSDATICPVFKSGDRQQCERYRGISLLCHTMKMYERILEKRLRKAVEEKLNDCQHGFRPNRSTTDLIFTLRQIVEKSWEYNTPINILALDLEKAFDRVPR